jgi:hypothetical protein
MNPVGQSSFMGDKIRLKIRNGKQFVEYFKGGLTG